MQVSVWDSYSHRFFGRELTVNDGWEDLTGSCQQGKLQRCAYGFLSELLKGFNSVRVEMVVRRVGSKEAVAGSALGLSPAWWTLPHPPT